MRNLPEWLELDPEVRGALDSGRPVVAMESAVWAQGLPRPMNLEVAMETCAAIREGGAVPAIVGVRDGLVRVGLNQGELEKLCGRTEFDKVGVGDLPGVLAQRRPGATTVSATLLIAQMVGIEVFSTGGLGGVHSEWHRHLDISGDLGELARTRCLTVCSGIKSVLDVLTTIELIETLGIPLALYGADKFPRFFTAGIKIGIGFRVDSPAEVVRAHQLALQTLGRGLVVAHPAPASVRLDLKAVEEWLREGLLRAENEHRGAKELTPFLMDYLARASGGATLESYRALLVSNARLAASFALELAGRSIGAPAL